MSGEWQFCDYQFGGSDYPTEVMSREDYALQKEVRVVDPKTGGEKGSKLARFDLIPPDALWALAEHYGRGARKYADRNWERGYNWSLSFAALERHLQQLKAGQDVDKETGTHHAIAVAWHAFALYVFAMRGLGTDDRVKVQRLGEEVV